MKQENLFIKEAFQGAQEVLSTILGDENFMNKIALCIEELSAAFRRGKKAISSGNGGSMCDAIHFAEELSGRFKNNRPALAAIAISDPGHISCVGNDYGYQDIFSRYLEGLGQEGDIYLGISTSGNSENIIKAMEVAKARGMKSIALLGKDGGKLKDMADISVIVPAMATERIQEVHIKIIHLIIEGIERKLYPELYA